MKADIKRGLSITIRVVLAALCIYLAIRVVLKLGPAEVWEIASQSDAVYLISTIFALGLFFYLWGVRWAVMTAREKRIPSSLLARLVALGAFLNLVTPTAKLAGGFARAYILHRRKWFSLHRSYGWVLADQLATGMGRFFVFGFLALISPLLIDGELNLIPLQISGSILLGISISWPWLRTPLFKAGSQWHGIIRFLPSAFIGPATSGKQWITSALTPALQSGKPSQILSVEVLFSAVIYLIFCYSNILVFKAIGVDASMGVVAIVTLLGYLGGSMLSVMGGIGATELILMELFSMAGIPAHQAAAGALLHRGLYYMVNLALGGIAMLYEAHHLQALKEKKSHSDQIT